MQSPEQVLSRDDPIAPLRMVEIGVVRTAAAPREVQANRAQRNARTTSSVSSLL